MGDVDLSTCFRVLALDGGGIRCYYTAALLSKLVEHFAGARGGVGRATDPGAAFDLICGTSGGAILACALASGVPLGRVAELYRRQGPGIFPRPSPINEWRNLGWCMRHWQTPSANATALRAALEGALGQETLGALYRRRSIAVCLAATDVARCDVRIMRTPHRSQHDGGMSLVDACMASSAAPILLPPVEYRAGSQTQRREELLCDGGVCANNPVLVALLEALAMAGPGREIRVLSVSSCPSNGREGQHPGHRSLGYWIDGLRLIQLSADAQSRAAAAWAVALAPLLAQPVHVLRLIDPPLAAADIEHLRIDNAVTETFDVLDRLADASARLNIAAASGGQDDLAWLPNFFRPAAHVGADSASGDS
jgi:predicted acylesterase/phospholipase RssA